MSKASLSPRGAVLTQYIVKMMSLGPTTIFRLGIATYDSLSMSQWVAGFCQIIREQNDPTIKNQISDYMEDSHDFGWQAVKECHAVVLVKMEEGKIAWGDPNKIGRVRRAHAQKVQSGDVSGASSKKTVKKQIPTSMLFLPEGHMWSNPRS